jgi:hypothetical protein
MKNHLEESENERRFKGEEMRRNRRRREKERDGRGKFIAILKRFTFFSFPSI